MESVFDLKQVIPSKRMCNINYYDKTLLFSARYHLNFYSYAILFLMICLQLLVMASVVSL